MSRPGRVLHVITGLGAGGAERFLARLAVALDPARWTQAVVALGPDGPAGDDLRRGGVPVETLDLRTGPALLGAPARLRAAASAFEPDLVQGWMYHGNLAATAAVAGSRVPVLWNVRQSLGAPEADRAATEVAIRVGARLSRSATRIVYNARSAARDHEAIGYASDRTEVIPNGFDTARFRPDPDARGAWRRRWGVGEGVPLAGCVARVHPVKDHATLLAAHRSVREVLPAARLVLIGSGTEALPPALAAAAGPSVIGAGEIDDVAGALNALDVAVLSSRAEAFPNALGEAMACGVACVATAVGDVAELVGGSGRLVPPGDPEALARAWIASLGESPSARRERGVAARSRIERRFAATASVAAYDRLYSAALGRGSL